MTTAASAPIAVLGAGSWGTALALLLARNGYSTRLWAHDPQHVAAMQAARCNPRYLSDIPFPSLLEPCADLAALLQGVRDALLVVPCRAFRATLEMLWPHLDKQARIAWASKGLEPGTDRLLHEVVAEVLGPQRAMAVVSGPTFAREVALGLPTAVTVASNAADFAADLTARLHSASFRAYHSDDVVGVEVGGAVKNVLAIAAGIADGLGLGANTRAALVTRGLAEMTRLGVALGGRRETFMGLAGLGDLVLTCTDDQSRNRRLGLALAHGASVGQALAQVQHVAEGVHTAQAVWRVAQARGIDMPIAEQVYAVLHEGRAPRAAVEALLQREPKAERY